VFNLKVDRQLSREYFTSDSIYNGTVGMTLYYDMCRSWQDCCVKNGVVQTPELTADSFNWYGWPRPVLPSPATVLPTPAHVVV